MQLSGRFLKQNVEQKFPVLPWFSHYLLVKYLFGSETVQSNHQKTRITNFADSHFATIVDNNYLQ